MAETSESLFHFDEGHPGFEDLGKDNGATHWDEGILMDALGYESQESFRKALTRAKQACLSLGIQCEEHFHLQDNGNHAITRFGCYLVAMNGDPRKPQVAAARAYFAAIAETFQARFEHADAIDRVLIRDEADWWIADASPEISPLHSLSTDFAHSSLLIAESGSNFRTSSYLARRRFGYRATWASRWRSQLEKIHIRL